MLSRNFRLRKTELDRLFKKGSFHREDFLMVKFMENRAGHARFAIVISKAVAKRAVDRNRLKRKTFAEIELILKNQTVKNADISLKYKFLPKEEEIRKTLEKIFYKILNFKF